jgi:Rieske Fe-S protein
MERRDFLKGTCRICLLGAAGTSLIDLAACSPSTGNAVTKTEVKDNKATIALVEFDKSPLQIISPKNYPYEVAVQKEQDGTYKALLLKCTHFDNQLVQNSNGYTCNFHGSRFDKKGTVVKGPASQPLTQLKTSITGTEIFIHLID